MDDTVAPQAGPARDTSRWQLADVELDENTLELRVRGELVAIERKPLELLMWLLRHPGEVVTKEELFDALWAGRVVTDSVLTKCVAKLRQALGDDGQAILKTVHGFGYRLVAPVERLSMQLEAPAPAEPALHVGDTPPLRPHWRLLSRFGGSRGENWLVAHGKSGEKRVFKFALDAAGLSQLKREVTLHRLLRETLGPRDDLVRVLDWNLDEAPFFIELEHCAQGSLADWLAAQAGQAPLTTRLELVAQTADALAAAHSAGVLHKDVKPSNVLVDTGPEGAPRARLGDFGSGKVLDAERLHALEITRMGFTQTLLADGSTSGTWAYLAPELVAGQAPTVRSDVFALGVLLYQMAVGDLRRPLAPGWERDLDDPLLRDDVAACCDQDASRRLGDASELARRLRTLDTRRSERAARERSEAEAAAARQALARAKARRGWLRAVAGLASVAALAIGALYLQVRGARDEATRHAESATAVTDFLVKDLIAAANPEIAGSPNASVREVLAAAEEQLASRFANQPDRAAALRNALAESRLGIGDLDAAAAGYEASARSQAAPALRAAAWLGLATTRAEQSRHADAQAALNEARPLVDLLRSREPGLALRHDLQSAVMLRLTGDATASVRQLLALQPALEAHFGAGSGEAIRLLTQLGEAQVEAGQLDEGLGSLRLALTHTEAAVGPDHARSLVQRLGIAQALLLAGQREAAEAAYREAHEIATRALGPQHLVTIELGHGLVNALPDERKATQGRALVETLLTTAKARFGADHVSSQNLLNTLALMVGNAGDRERERALYAELLASQRRTLGNEHFFTLITQINIARSHTRSRQFVQALDWATRAHETARATLDESNYVVCVFASQRATALAELGRRDEARALAEPCVERLTALLGAEHRHTRGLAELLARL